MLKRLSLYTLFLCLVPIFAWLSGWHWNEQITFSKYDYALYLLTESGSTPYALITCALFALLFGVFFRNRKQWIVAVIIMATSIAITQGLKSGLKTLFAEPRPYVSYVAEQTQTSTENFYQQSRQARSEFVKNFYQTQPNTPSWLKNHYKNEVGYSFPSGHAIFAASWLMLAVGFAQLVGKKNLSGKIMIGLVAIWASLMLISRLRFGMHHPIDLFASITVAWVIHCGLFTLLRTKPNA